ncbi:MAG: patatin-like phospholipase family protein [Defluviimonas sp.]|nr:patatin-like phospholipase family protein [Paracoccaceae bacterium]MCC0065013.1 patatin-like phospholipase family protein [Defluviimonas sp.]
MLPFLVAFIASCATPERTPYTLADQMAAEVPGYKEIRFYADMPAAELAGQRDHFLPTGLGADGRASWLALSAGGAGGAFGAGVLIGWSERGDRPAFDLVTGVSAGALLAPFAFVGPSADRELASLFTAASVERLNRSRSLLAGVFGQGALPSKELRALIDAHLDDALVERIAARHRAGARLLIVTTNLDAQRSVVWDIGAIAASDRPDRVRLIGDVLEASASIPAIFPPVRIAVTGNDRAFEELHADGGAMRQVYLLPEAYQPDTTLGGLRPDIHVIVNAELAPRFNVIPQQSIRIAERALESLEKSNASDIVTDLAEFARRNRATFRLAYIDRAIPSNRRIPFDPNYMQAAFALGQVKGRAGAWEAGPPIGTGFLEAK